MKESISALKGVLNAVMIAVMLGAGWLGYKFVTEPGYLAELAMGIDREELAPWGATLPDTGGGMQTAPSDRVVTSRLPQASGTPQASGGTTQRRQSTGSGSGATTSAGTYAPRTTATGRLRTVSRKKNAPAEAYVPPVAQRKVIRVDE